MDVWFLEEKKKNIVKYINSDEVMFLRNVGALEITEDFYSDYEDRFWDKFYKNGLRDRVYKIYDNFLSETRSVRQMKSFFRIGELQFMIKQGKRLWQSCYLHLRERNKIILDNDQAKNLKMKLIHKKYFKEHAGYHNNILL